MDKDFTELDSLLTEIGRKLDEAPDLIRALDFDPEKNVRSVGEALVLVFGIQHEIYKVQPELEPDFLKKKDQ